MALLLLKIQIFNIKGFFSRVSRLNATTLFLTPRLNAAEKVYKTKENTNANINSHV